MRIIPKFDPTKNKIYVDMDGVIADFDAFTLERTGKIYGANEPGGTAKDQELWDFLGQVPHLYDQLKPTPYAFELWDLVNSFGVPVEILTAVPRRSIGSDGPLSTSAEDKKIWMARYFSPSIKVNIGPLSKDKWKHAAPGDILIDDRVDNIRDWGLVRGIGILHDYENYPATAGKLLAIRAEALGV